MTFRHVHGEEEKWRPVTERSRSAATFPPPLDGFQPSFRADARNLNFLIPNKKQYEISHPSPRSAIRSHLLQQRQTRFPPLHETRHVESHRTQRE
jgi:hypothetical protein